MRTQKHDLKDKIKELENKLGKAVYSGDAFEQMALYKELDNVKSIFINIQ